MIGDRGGEAEGGAPSIDAELGKAETPHQALHALRESVAALSGSARAKFYQGELVADVASSIRQTLSAGNARSADGRLS